MENKNTIKIYGDQMEKGDQVYLTITPTGETGLYSVVDLQRVCLMKKIDLPYGGFKEIYTGDRAYKAKVEVIISEGGLEAAAGVPYITHILYGASYYVLKK